MAAMAGPARPAGAQVGVVGPGEASEREQTLAYEVGARLARAGLVVVTGGLGGVMAAASRGAVEAGGCALGLLPADELAGGNPYLSVVVPTGLGEARNALLVRASLGLIAIGGGWGTLSEIALALRAGRPVVSLGSWEPQPPPGHATGNGTEHARVLRAVDPEQAVRFLLAALG